MFFFVVIIEWLWSEKIILPHPAATAIRDGCCLFIVYCCSDCLCRFLFLALVFYAVLI